MNLKIRILFVVLMASQFAFGQLGRRAFLGTRLIEMNDSLARIAEIKSPEGVYVQDIVPGGTGEKIGISAGDVILSINNMVVNASSELVSLIGSMQAGDKAIVDIFHKGKKQTLKGNLEPLPLQTSEFGKVVYGEAAFDGGHVRTILYKPQGTGKFPAVFFIQGYGCYSVENLGSHSYQQIVDGLLQKGYVVVKTEKACAGDSRNNQPCRDYDFWKEVDLFSASFNALTDYNFIDLENVYIFGHSMGGIQAPLLKTDFPPKAIAVYGTVTRPWFEYLTEQARIQKLLVEGNYIQNEQEYETAVRFYYQFLIEKQTPMELVKNPDFRQLLLSSWNCDGSEYMNDRHYSFWQQLQDTKLFKAWSETTAHVFSIWGEGDFIAFNPYEHQLVADIVNQYHPGQAEFIRLPQIDHNFIRVDSREHAIEIFRDYNYQQNNFNPAITEMLHDCFKNVKAVNNQP